MEKRNIESFEAPPTGTRRDPWDEFERTGSIQAYLDFVQENRLSGVSEPLPGLPS